MTAGLKQIWSRAATLPCLNQGNGKGALLLSPPSTDVVYGPHINFPQSLTTSMTNTTQKEAPPTTQEEEVPLLNSPQEGGDQGGDQGRQKSWNKMVEEVNEATAVYNKTWSLSKMEGAAVEVVKRMRNIATTHPDPKVKKEWNDSADEFAKTSKAKRDLYSSDIMKGLGLLVAAPVALAGAVVFVAGGVLYSAGSAFKDIGGSLLACGKVGLSNGDLPLGSADEEQEPPASST